MSPCRSDHLFTTEAAVFGVWPLRILVAYVGIQPFLLIDRTCRIVTAHEETLLAAFDMASSAGFTVFPAFSRIL
jgi:hypothetical protein